LVPRMALKVISSKVASPLTEIPLPFRNVSVSADVSATGLVPAGVDMVSNRFCDDPTPEGSIQVKSPVVSLYLRMYPSTPIPPLVTSRSISHSTVRYFTRVYGRTEVINKAQSPTRYLKTSACEVAYGVAGYG